MTSRPEIYAAMCDGRDLTESEKTSFALDEMALYIRMCLKWTRQQRDTIDGSTDINFPVNPGYQQFELWAYTLEQAANAFRDRSKSNPDDLEPYENTLSIEELRREVRWLWDNKGLLMRAIRDKIDMPPPGGAGVWSRIRAGLNDNEGIGCLNMLVFCGELGGKQPNETYPQYLRRLIDFVATQSEEQKYSLDD